MKYTFEATRSTSIVFPYHVVYKIIPYNIPSSEQLTPQDVNPPPSLHRLRWRLRVLPRDIKVLLNRHLIQRHNLSLGQELVAKEEREDERDVEVRREERLRIPITVNEDRVSSREEDDEKGNEAYPGGIRLERGFPGQLIA